MMTEFMTWSLIAFMIGVVVKRFINTLAGDAIEVVAAVLFVLAFLLTVVR
jgi:hypothetical protein